MKKYLQVFKNTWSEYSVYRLNFIMWRVRIIIRLLLVLFLWNAVFQGKNTSFGLTNHQILNYILMSNLVFPLILGSRTIDMGNEINQGNLSLYLIRPISYLGYWFSKDLADKLLNLLFSIVEVTLLFIIFKPQITLNFNFASGILFIASLILGMLLYFNLNLIFGFLAFFTPEIWAPRFLFFMLLEFLSGQLFPLNILPSSLFNFLMLLPFAYFIYFPLSLVTQYLSANFILRGFALEFFWLIFLFAVAKKMWVQGLKVYSAEGR